MRKTSMVEQFSWLWWFNAEPLFIVFLTGKMFWPRISLEIRRFGPGLQWSNRRSIFWKENQRMFDQFSLFLFSTRMFFNWGASHFDKWIFLNSIHLFGFKSLELQVFLNLWVQKGWPTNRRKPHRNWSFRGWEIWIYSWVMRFPTYFLTSSHVRYQSITCVFDENAVEVIDSWNISFAKAIMHHSRAKIKLTMVAFSGTQFLNFLTSGFWDSFFLRETHSYVLSN